MDFDAPYKDFGLYAGIVTDNVDPTKNGRVIVTIPGVLEPGMWADVCMPGSPFSNGIFAVPAINAQVFVMFMNGDREYPVVMGGQCPPVQAGGSRASMAPETLAKTMTIENDDWVVMLGKSDTEVPYLDVRSRPKEDGSICRFVIDFDQQVAELTIPQSISIKSQGLINLEGNLTQINERPVQEGSTPI